MIATVIFRPPAAPVIHQPVPEDAVRTRGPHHEALVRTVCGATGIAPVIHRDGITCAECTAMAGRHPGGKGKVLLHKQWLERTGRR